MQQTALLGIAGSSLGALVACGGDDAPSGDVERPLEPTFLPWMLAVFPEIERFGQENDIQVREAPVEGFGVQRFVAEARELESTWDMYVGMTPFVDMSQLIRGGVIEPWDPYVSGDVLEAIIPSVRDEATVDGETYLLPFNIQITITSQHAGLIAAADIDPDEIPETWDELIERARAIQQAEAAPFGLTFDALGWRSLVPITHSIDTDVYDEDGLFDFTHDAAIEALEIMRRMTELANPDVLQLGAADGGINDTPDESVWAAEQAAYYIKFSAGTIRFANMWTDPDALRLGPLPKTPDGVGGTGFWSSGAALFKHGVNKEEAAEFMWDLVHDEEIQRRGMGTEEPYGGLCAYDTIWGEWQEDTPEWLAEWAFPLREQLEVARAIPPTILGLDQFMLPKTTWERYLTGEETDPRKVMAEARDIVRDELREQES